MSDYDRELGQIGEALKSLSASYTTLQENHTTHVLNTDKRLASIEKSVAERKGAERVIVWVAGFTGGLGVIAGALGKYIATSFNS